MSIMIFIMVASSMVSNAYAGDEKLFVNVGKLNGKTNYTRLGWSVIHRVFGGYSYSCGQCREAL